MKVKITENTRQTGQFGCGRRGKKTTSIWFLGRENWQRVRDNVLVRGGYEDELDISTSLNSEVGLLPMYKNNLVTYCSILWLPYARIESFSRNIQRNRCFYLWRWLPESHEGGFIQCPHLRYSQREPLGQCSQPWLHNIITWRALRKFWCPDYSQDQWRQTLEVEDRH